MKKLPIVISIPHAGIAIPPEVAGNCLLTGQQVIDDGDVGADAIYSPLAAHVSAWQKSEIARAVVDLNREQNDLRKDGVVKTHTCWEVPIYREPLTKAEIEALLTRYYHPYHESLRHNCSREGIKLGLDCHTMAVSGPPVGPDPGEVRPFICLGNANDTSAPRQWIESLAEILEREFNREVAINAPFSGGYISRHYSQYIPWIQLEMARTETPSDSAKRAALIRALTSWLATLTASAK